MRFSHCLILDWISLLGPKTAYPKEKVLDAVAEALGSLGGQYCCPHTILYHPCNIATNLLYMGVLDMLSSKNLCPGDMVRSFLRGF